MPSLRPRAKRLEARFHEPGCEPITEIHHRIINPDGTPALNLDGTPLVIIHKVGK